MKAFGSDERITMVTSFRPRSPAIADDTTLSNVRPVSDLSMIYHQFAVYRLEMLKERIRQELKLLHGSHRANKKTDTRGIKKFMQEQLDFMAHTMKELVDEEDVVMGQVENPFPTSAPGLRQSTV